jgi:glycosyltransferase involved in cell wall biosynthesis
VFFIASNGVIGHFRDILIQKILYKKHQYWFTIVQNGNFNSVFKRTWHSQITKAFFTKVDKIILTSEGLRAKVTDYLGEEKTSVIYNSIDRELYIDSNEYRKPTINDSFNVLYLSNMNPTKGYMDLAKSILLIPTSYRKNIRVKFVGEWLSETQRREFIDFLETNNLRDIIQVYGKVNSRKQIKTIYEWSNVFVLPTYFPQEAQPVSILEALNYGLPVISTDHASIPEFITDGGNGFLIKKRNPESIKNRLIELIDNHDLYFNLSANARQTFQKQFSPDVYEKKILQLIMNE